MRARSGTPPARAIRAPESIHSDGPRWCSTLSTHLRTACTVSPSMSRTMRGHLAVAGSGAATHAAPCELGANATESPRLLNSDQFDALLNTSKVKRLHLALTPEASGPMFFALRYVTVVSKRVFSLESASTGPLPPHEFFRWVRIDTSNCIYKSEERCPWAQLQKLSSCQCRAKFRTPVRLE
jgi:hypothetical protein